MNPMCITCAARGRRLGCAKCLSMIQPPRFQIVQDIIGRVAKEHRLSQLQAEQDFKEDFAGMKDTIEKAKARYRAKCRRRAFREKVKQAQEVA